MINPKTVKPKAGKPKWLKRRLPAGAVYENVKALIKDNHLYTVCQEAICPNIWECFSKKTATFLIMGPRCTRKCGFCAVAHGPMEALDPNEPATVALAAKKMGLLHVVVTSVTRDDLPDGGAEFFAKTVRKLQKEIPKVTVEVLIPDFKGDAHAIEKVVRARPDVINHNIETCEKLYPSVRPGADYGRSLTLLKKVKDFNVGIPEKSGMMLGLGETPEEILKTFEDLRDAGTTFLTLGQYLQPTKKHLPIKRYVPPFEFDKWREKALDMGFLEVSSGPFVRSSYHADQMYNSATNNGKKNTIGATI
jgi:lipoic acid synthetase